MTLFPEAVSTTAERRCRFPRIALIVLSVALAPAAAAADPPTAAGYGNIEPSRDGIGKTWLGREISQVMGHPGAAWLERADRERSEGTDLLVAALPLSGDAVVADIGAGTGYFSFRMAERVPAGRVLAVDIQPEMLAIIRRRADAAGIGNVEPVLGSVTGPGLPERSVDLALLVDAYHEFSHPLEMARGIYRGLKPGGIVVLIEYRAEDPTVMIKPLHKMTAEQARREWEAAGFRFVENRDLLPQQHFLVFERPRKD
ncbi:MAG: class I SAM-dependent methyltransferase [Gammaproteobacteria bacterium]|nr:class I SAM-dependent methyltransferase [Gammaproteobacteria bacterium]